MGKMIFAINHTIDGTAGHEYGIADDELHDFHTEMLKSVDAILFGRKTYQLMENFWPLADVQQGMTEATLRFADTINGMQKLVVSQSIKEVSWENTKLISGDLEAEVRKLKTVYNRVAVGGLQLANALADLNLIDEYWFLVQPFLVGKGAAWEGKPPMLFEKLQHTHKLELVDMGRLHSGVVVLHYKSGQ